MRSNLFQDFKCQTYLLVFFLFWAHLGFLSFALASDHKNGPFYLSQVVNKVNFISLGPYTEFYDQIQIDVTGTLKKFDSAPTLGLGRLFALGTDYYLIPEIDWVIPRKSGQRVIKHLFFFRTDFAHSPLEWLLLRIGTSLVWTNQQGGGGTQEINNGNSYSTFYYPIANRSSLNNTIDLGAELFYKDFSLRFQTYTFSIFKRQRRQISYSLFLSYYWENKIW